MSYTADPAADAVIHADALDAADEAAKYWKERAATAFMDRMTGRTFDADDVELLAAYIDGDAELLEQAALLILKAFRGKLVAVNAFSLMEGASERYAKNEAPLMQAQAIRDAGEPR